MIEETHHFATADRNFLPCSRYGFSALEMHAALIRAGMGLMPTEKFDTLYFVETFLLQTDPELTVQVVTEHDDEWNYGFAKESYLSHEIFIRDGVYNMAHAGGEDARRWITQAGAEYYMKASSDMITLLQKGKSRKAVSHLADLLLCTDEMLEKCRSDRELMTLAGISYSDACRLLEAHLEKMSDIQILAQGGFNRYAVRRGMMLGIKKDS